jgi:hypothetical protein
MNGSIETHTTLEGFFGDLIREAMAAERLVLDDGCVQYLLQLCRELARSEALFEVARPGENGTPALVWLYEKAQTSDRGLKFQAYRKLGDVSLVVSGFFAPHIERERSLVGVDYYVQMGAAAYDSAATLAQPTGFGSLLSELASKFRKIVEVLTRVAEQTTLPVARDVIALYERLCRNPESEALTRRLVVERKMIPCFAPMGAKS